jgi:hypothetical protein
MSESEWPTCALLLITLTVVGLVTVAWVAQLGLSSTRRSKQISTPVATVAPAGTRAGNRRGPSESSGWSPALDRGVGQLSDCAATDCSISTRSNTPPSSVTLVRGTRASTTTTGSSSGMPEMFRPRSGDGAAGGASASTPNDERNIEVNHNDNDNDDGACASEALQSEDNGGGGAAASDVTQEDLSQMLGERGGD